MKNPDYIILTPTAPFKLYCFNRFIKNVISFRPKPKEIVFCTEPEMVPEISGWEKELKKRGIKLVIFTLEPEILNKFPAIDIEKLTYSREHLRHYFINSPYKWALWLDSDIIPEPNVAQVLLDIAQSKKFLVVANEYRSRMTKGLIIKGMGCTLTHKAACTFARFQIAPFVWNRKEVACLADDFWFFAMLFTGNNDIKKWTGWNSRKVGRFVSIQHIPKHGRSKFLKKERKK
ncbi:hypothetical protein ES703_118118 [subsurface metagenome]